MIKIWDNFHEIIIFTSSSAQSKDICRIFHNLLEHSIDWHAKKIEIVFSHVDFRVAHKYSLLDISDSLRGDRIKTNLAYLVKSNIPGKAGSKSWEGLTQTFQPLCFSLLSSIIVTINKLGIITKIKMTIINIVINDHPRRCMLLWGNNYHHDHDNDHHHNYDQDHLHGDDVHLRCCMLLWWRKWAQRLPHFSPSDDDRDHGDDCHDHGRVYCDHEDELGDDDRDHDHKDSNYWGLMIDIGFCNGISL